MTLLFFFNQENSVRMNLKKYIFIIITNDVKILKTCYKYYVIIFRTRILI